MPTLRSLAISRSLAFPLLLALALVAAGPAPACTLWSATGIDEQTDKVIFLAKNRDWTPDHRQALNVVRTATGHDYLGLLAIDGEEPGLKAGINRQGLAIVSASASSIPRQTRKEAPGKRGVMRRLLSSCASVKELLNAQDIFATARPMFLLAADRHQALVVEIGQNGEYRVDMPQKAFSAHTNHFLHPGLAANNRKIGGSSRQRLATITTRLHQAPHPLTLAEMVAISEDRSHGPNDSILRTGTKPNQERTLATWIVALPSHGDPTLYVKLRNPGEEERTLILHLDQKFWQAAHGSDIAAEQEAAARYCESTPPPPAASVNRGICRAPSLMQSHSSGHFRGFLAKPAAKRHMRFVSLPRFFSCRYTRRPRVCYSTGAIAETPAFRPRGRP